MATCSCSSESKRRRRSSGVVRSLPSSTSSPLSVSRTHRDNCTCRRGPALPSSSSARCYHHPRVDPPFWAADEPVFICADPLTGYCARIGPSHLIYNAVLGGFEQLLSIAGQ